MQLNQIIYINEIKFVCQLVEKVFREQGIECYTLDQKEDFTYLINDLNPDVLIINDETFQLFGDDFFSSIEAASKKPKVVLMTNQAQSNFLTFDAIMPQEINPLTFVQDIRNLLGEQEQTH